MKKVIFVLALSGLVTFGSYAVSATADNSYSIEFSKGGDKKKKKNKKECCSTDEKSKCCEKKEEPKKTEEQPK